MGWAPNVKCPLVNDAHHCIGYDHKKKRQHGALPLLIETHCRMYKNHCEERAGPRCLQGVVPRVYKSTNLPSSMISRLLQFGGFFPTSFNINFY
jgi:hypothetical protein